MSAALDDAGARQRRASDPATSAWVSANAGSGKTHVLAQRVIRLLLAGAPPSRILCLTFTKAAAANMSDRVFNTLAKWPKLDDEKLTAEIAGLGAEPPKPHELEQARNLFARIIETPGGLKIQTLHAFCERVLHLFPFEANVPAGFRPLDEREAAALHEQAQARMFAAARDGELGAAIERVAEIVDANGFGPLLAETARLGEALTIHGDPGAFAEKLGARLGLAPGEDEPAIKRAMRVGGGGPANWRRWASALQQGLATDQKLATLLKASAATDNIDDCLGLYLQVFLVKELSAPRAKMATKSVAARFPAEAAALYAERDRLVALLDKRRAAKAVARSRDLYAISEAAEAAYARAKAARGTLDFNDLIEKTAALFNRTDAAWILYKLDKGVEHILVDEAQDTSRLQWSILAKLAEDFLSGEGAGSPRRTFFAVGDEKQSIFSFQGAAPHLFDGMRRFFAKRLERAKRAFADEKLIHSFRSAPAVLEAVDKVFGHEDAWRGVSAGEATAVPHFAIRDRMPGVVEIWPPIVAKAPEEPGEWELPLDAQKLTHPAVALAERIAAVIAQWTSPGSPERIVDSGGAPCPIRAGDILILVRSRGPLFEAMTRALRRARVPAAGADRLTLAHHIAVLDLCAAARAALSRDDDLSLAAVLKSPLIGLDDEALMRIAPRREGPLSAALAGDPAYAAAHAKLEVWRARAATAAPFDFFARLLGPDGGRRALISRLGGEAGDVIDEFLARALSHERGDAPSLPGFLAEIEAADAEIKRDMDAAGEAVRVMTVHAAKGLEAPIVFLPDTHGAPSGRHDPKWLRLPPPNSTTPPLLVWATPAADDSAEMAQGRAKAREAAAGEHRRLLYVAMTRAAQRLVIAGYQGARDPPPDAWMNLVMPGLSPHLSDVPSWWDPQARMLRLGTAARGETPQPPAAPPLAFVAPAWMTIAAPRETAPAPIAPSNRLAGTVGPERLARIEEGRLAHRLLQDLPGLAPERRRAAAEAWLLAHGGAIPPERRAALVARMIALIENPALAPLFGPGSRAEVPIAATLARSGRAPVAIAGRIDRLAAHDGNVWLADFKTGAGTSRPQYIRQLAVYRAAVAPLFPGADIKALLLWLDNGTFEELAPESLTEAFEAWARDD